MYRKLFNRLVFNRLDSNSFFSKRIADLLFYLFLTNPNKIDYFGYFTRNLAFNHRALWSSPQSGNHWVRFIAEYLTSSPTYGGIGNAKDVPIYLNTFPGKEHPLAHVNPKNPFILYKSHWAYKATFVSAILLIIRDYHELISRPRNVINFIGTAFDYLDLIVAYDRFKGDKMVIYYEDLLTYPEREISRIRYFLNGSYERYKAFIENYNYYKKLSQQGGNRDWRGFNSSSDLKFFQKKLSEQNLITRKNAFQKLLTIKRYRGIKLYLARYG